MNENNAPPNPGEDIEVRAGILWKLAHSFWQEPGVEAACLAWQAECGLDVSFLVWAAWTAVSGEAVLSRQDVEAANERISTWRAAVIDPARHARKAVRMRQEELLPSDFEVLYSHLRAVELRAEQAEQRMLLSIDVEVRADSRAPSVRDAMELVITTARKGPMTANESTRLRVMAEQFERLARNVVEPR
jgi:uncharacterized protein (TIGR02444 family)